MKISYRKITAATNTANIAVAPAVSTIEETKETTDKEIKKEAKEEAKIDELDDINDFITEDGLSALYGAVETALKDKYDSINWDTTSDSILCIAVPKDTKQVLEFNIPFADLKFDDTDADATYIINAMEATVDDKDDDKKESITSSLDINSIEPNYITEYKITTTDGQTLIGTIDDIDDQTIVLDETTMIGDTVYLDRSEIVNIEYLESE